MSESGKSKKPFPRLVARAFRYWVLASFASGWASLMYYGYLFLNSPRRPLAATGQTIELNNHGTSFFVRPFEAVLAAICIGFGLAMVLAAAALSLIYGDIPDQWPSNTYRFIDYFIVGLVALAIAGTFWSFMRF